MTTIAKRSLMRNANQPVLVSAPSIKFAIGMTAALCAVFAPRLIAALTTVDRQAVTFISRDYFFLAVSFSALVAAAVTILEWRVPRAPGDTFTVTLGLPAILAGALSASQGTAALQRSIEVQDRLATELSERGGIPIQRGSGTRGENPQGSQGALFDLLMPPLYAQGARSVPREQASPRFGISIEQPRFHIVLDRAQNEADANKRASELTDRANRDVPGSPLAVQIEKQANDFLIVAVGGPRIKSDAVLEALRLKDLYNLSPSLVEAETRR